MGALRRALDEIAELVEKLREFDEKRELCEAILEQIAEIREILERDEEDELKAFRLLIVLIEMLKGLGGRVPLLEEFITLYLAALKSALYVLETSIMSHGHIHDTCMHYCRARQQKERLLREQGMETDEEYIARKGHESAMVSVGAFTYEKYQDKFRKQYADYLKILELERLAEKAEELGHTVDSTSVIGEGGGALDVGGSTPSGPPPEDWEKIHARLLAWIEFGRQIASRAAEIQRELERDDLGPERRRELERELERLKDIIKRLFG